ncbi:DUF1924 domain-containing protein [Thiohalomonas denitrificans]|uniref:Cytochrome c domain-containing protein n=1 Tax=Thiohalomonas denitrificans TaxID=415747 RepID=A0A1G5PKQ8_9GAMM|nr:DUF1924 domain-containing protein [Thiohalomonas denitrificans]SCZ49946.1 protein of unknown function [Thiohalomonas denitrificans]
MYRLLSTCSLFLFGLLVTAPVLGAGAPVDGLLKEYQRDGAGEFSAEEGRRLWRAEGEQGRSCASCHTDDLTASGKHARTGKPIEPLAPSNNPEQLTERREITKWLYRNCKWTLGRACTAQEKGDFLSYIRTQ